MTTAADDGESWSGAGDLEGVVGAGETEWTEARGVGLCRGPGSGISTGRKHLLAGLRREHASQAAAGTEAASGPEALRVIRTKTLLFLLQFA